MMSVDKPTWIHNGCRVDNTVARRVPTVAGCPSRVLGNPTWLFSHTKSTGVVGQQAVRGDSWYLVVLAHEEDGQLPDSRHVERLVEEALVGGRR